MAVQLFWLHSDTLQLAVAPAMGGALARLDARRGGAWQPLLRPMGEGRALPLADPNRDAASYPLLPWSNRVGGGGFHFDGRFHALARNRDDEPWPIHGSGWQQAWQISEHREGQLQMQLQFDEGGVYRYAAWQRLRLHADTVQIELGVRNLGEAALPFGLGLHPFFVRDTDTWLQAPATVQWRARSADALPDHCVAVAGDADFSALRALSHSCIDHAFEGWDGHARIAWPQRGLSLSLASDCRRFVLYTPTDAAFFCFEPVDHPIDALNLAGGAQAHGMTVLAPQQQLTRQLRMQVQVA